MVEVRLVHAKKQFYSFIMNVAKILVTGLALLIFLAIHLRNLMGMQNSLMFSLIADQPKVLLSDAGIRALLEIFPFFSFLCLILSGYLLYRFIKQFNAQQIIPLNSPLYEIL